MGLRRCVGAFSHAGNCEVYSANEPAIVGSHLNDEGKPGGRQGESQRVGRPLSRMRWIDASVYT